MSDEYAPQYILFVDGTCIGPFPPDEKLLDGSRDGSIIERYVLDQGWDDLAYSVIASDELPQGDDIQVQPPRTQGVTVNLRLIGIAPGVDPRFALMQLFDAVNSKLEDTNLPSIYLAEREV